MQITNQRVRLAIDTAQMGPINDVLTGASPKFWNGVDLQFELGIFRGQTLVDISNFDSITVDLKASDPRTGLPLMSKTLGSGSFNNSLNLNAWNGGLPSDCHALIAFTNAESNLDLSDDQMAFWLVISALTSDDPAHKIVLGATPLNVIEGGEGVAPPASVVAPLHYTAAQADARFLLAFDETTIDNRLSTLESGMTAVTTTANAALPKAGGTMTGNLTVTGLSGMLRAVSGLVTGSSSTDNLPEGSSNFYYTNARADARITAARGAVSGVCPLDSSSLVPAVNLPEPAFGHVFTVATQSAMLALSATKGDLAIRTDLNQTFVLSTNSPSTLADWKEILAPLPPVTSVNSFTGAVTLDSSVITENTNLYYTSARAAAAALAATLAGFSSASGGAVTSGDSILSALGKFENRLALNDAKTDGSDRVKKDGTTPMTGMLNFTGTGHAGLELNNLTDTQRAALSPVAGMLIYNTTLSAVQYYNGTWLTLATGGNAAWYNGGGAPSNGAGNDGDYYLRTDNGSIYQKSSGVWAVIYNGPMSLTGGVFTGDVSFNGGKVKLNESGGGAIQGTAVLNGTTAVVISTTAITANSRVWLSVQSLGGTLGTPYVSARSAGVSFSVKSTNASDTSTVAWFITEPA